MIAGYIEEAPMSEWYKSITSEMKQFIAEQKVFFVATALHEGRINPFAQGYGHLPRGR